MLTCDLLNTQVCLMLEYLLHTHTQRTLLFWQEITRVWHINPPLNVLFQWHYLNSPRHSVCYRESNALVQPTKKKITFQLGISLFIFLLSCFPALDFGVWLFILLLTRLVCFESLPAHWEYPSTAPLTCVIPTLISHSSSLAFHLQAGEKCCL